MLWFLTCILQVFVAGDAAVPMCLVNQALYSCAVAAAAAAAAACQLQAGLLSQKVLV